MYSNQFPDGDLGGNLYNISAPNYPTIDELHALWDSGAGQWGTDLPRPLTSAGSAWISNFTNTILIDYPTSMFTDKLAIFNTTEWAYESNGYATSFAYTAPYFTDGPISDAYINQAQGICLQQVALGGYRLATLLEYIFGENGVGSDALLKRSVGENLNKLSSNGVSYEKMAQKAKLHKIR